MIPFQREYLPQSRVRIGRSLFIISLSENVDGCCKMSYCEANICVSYLQYAGRPRLLVRKKKKKKKNASYTQLLLRVAVVRPLSKSCDNRLFLWQQEFLAQFLALYKPFPESGNGR